MHNIIAKLIEYNGTDVARINHALKVYGFASAIARSENLSEKELFIVEALGVLHDIGIKESEKKYNSSAGKYQEIEGPPIARQLLKEMNVEDDIVERICFIIGNHHNYPKIDGIDFQILVEADFLVNIFEDKMTSIESIRTKYFKTKTGTKFLEQMYSISTLTN